MTYGAAAAGESILSRATERDNARVWDGAKAGHYEVWYLTLSHRAERLGFWIRYTMEAPLPGHGEPYAQLWFAAFDAADPARSFAINRRFPIAAMRARATPFEVAIDDALLTHGGARGALAGDGHEARWDLSWLPAPRTHRHLPDLAYRGSWATTQVLSPNLDVPVRGTVSLDGREVVFDGEPGGQTHLWGKKHAHAWAWGHCNAFAGRRGAVLEALCVRLKRRGLVLPPLTVLSLTVDGEELRFTGFRDTLTNRGRFGTGRFAFTARGTGARLEGELTCRPEAMVTAEYADPDGEPSYCANTCAGDLAVTVWRRSSLVGRWREAARLSADGTAHFEVAGREPDPAIARRHVTLL